MKNIILKGTEKVVSAELREGSQHDIKNRDFTIISEYEAIDEDGILYQICDKEDAVSFLIYDTYDDQYCFNYAEEGKVNVVLMEEIKKIGGHINKDMTIVEFSFDEDVSNDNGESITNSKAIKIEEHMMGFGFDGGMIGSELDDEDFSVLRFDI